MKIASATPVLFVDRVEPTRDFFKRVGDELTYEEPGGHLVTFAKFHR